MPLEELKKYRGSSPVPADVDDYWNRAVEEVTGLGTDFEWEEADFASPVGICRHLRFKGLGGSRIHAKAVLPEGDGPYPALLSFHGYTAASRPWSEYLAYAASGIAVFALDCRGQGGMSEDLWDKPGATLYGDIVKGVENGPEALYFRSVFLDTVQLANIVMSLKEVDKNRMGAFGGSQGGALTLACASLVPEIRCLAPLYPFLSDYHRVWEMDLDQRAYTGLRDYFRKFDPVHEREDEFFTTLGYIDVANMVHRIKGSVLFGSTLRDETCPPSTQFAAFNRITSKKEMVLYPDYGHENIPDFNDRTYLFLVDSLRK